MGDRVRPGRPLAEGLRATGRRRPPDRPDPYWYSRPVVLHLPAGPPAWSAPPSPNTFDPPPAPASSGGGGGSSSGFSGGSSAAVAVAAGGGGSWLRNSDRAPPAAGRQPVGSLPASPTTSRARKSSRLNRLSPARSATCDQRGHRGDLLDLLLEEPLHELLAEVVALVAGGPRERLDLLGDRAAPARSASSSGSRARSKSLRTASTPGIATGDVLVQQVLHHHHRVVAFFQRLLVEVPGQLRQVLIVVPDSHRCVLLGRREFVTDLFLQKFFVRAHPVNLVGTTGFHIVGASPNRLDSVPVRPPRCRRRAG